MGGGLLTATFSGCPGGPQAAPLAQSMGRILNKMAPLSVWSSLGGLMATPYKPGRGTFISSNTELDTVERMLQTETVARDYLYEAVGL